MAGVEKLLPQNVDAEASFLGCVLIAPEEVLPLWADRLKPEDFYREAHRLIWEAMCDLFHAHRNVDLITLYDELVRRGKLDEVGGPAFVSSLANAVPTWVGFDDYAAIIQRTAVNRRVIQVAGQMAALAYNEPDAETVLEQSYKLLRGVAAGHMTTDSTPFGVVLDHMLDEFLDIMEGRLQGVRTGLVQLDAHTTGFWPGELVYLVGRPGMAKSALAVEIARSVAWACAERGTGCVEVMSLEMKETQLGQRVTAALGGIDTRILRAGFKRPDGTIDRDRYYAAKAATEQLRVLAMTLRLRDTPLSVGQVRSHLARAVAERGCVLGVVDYLGLLDLDSDRHGRESDYQRVSAISRELKQVALELDIPILCVAQLNRANESRANKRPLLSDIRDSGCAEQDADWVLAIHRQAYYEPQRTQPSNAQYDPLIAEFAEVIILKARGGMANVTVPLRFEGAYTRFSDWTEPRWPDDPTRAQ